MAKNEKKKTRRGRGEGSIRYIESKKLYEARYPIGVDPETGKTVYKSVYDKKKSMALRKMRDALQALGKGEYVDPSDMALYAWCKEWYEVYKEPSLKKRNTKDKYIYSLKRLKKAPIANARLKDIGQDAGQEIIQKYYNNLKKEYAEDTIRITHTLINSALEKAEQLKMIHKNPTRFATIPKDEVETEARALNDEQYNNFMAELGRRSHYYMFALFQSNTGLRPGEEIALNRSDLNFGTDSVIVDKTYLKQEKRNQNSTKTTSSRRDVPVPRNIMALMKEYMLKQKNKHPDAPLFQSLTGTRLSPRNIARQFTAVGEAIGCDWVTPHTLRHTYASRLFKEKIDIKVISSLLGHKKISTTYDLYVHFIDNIREDSVQVLNEGIPETLPVKSRKKKDNVTELKVESS